ncbi:MAG: type IV pilus secretin PilQ [Pseudomonadota bacterium]
MNQARLSLSALLIISCLAVGLFACGTSEKAAQPTAASAGAQAGSTVPLLARVTSTTEDNQTKVTLEGNESLTYTAFYQATPPVIFIDLGAEAAKEALGERIVANGTVGNVEALTVPGVSNLVRIKIALTRPSTYRVARDGNDLNVLVKNVKGPALGAPVDLSREAAASGPGLTGEIPTVSDFFLAPLGGTGRSRLTVNLSRPVIPKIHSRDYGRTVVLGLAPAFLPPDQVRTVHASGFRSAAASVCPSTLDNQVEFLIKLQAVTPYHLGQKGSSIFLDFDSPSRPAAPAASSAFLRPPAPAGPAYQAPAQPNWPRPQAAARVSETVTVLPDQKGSGKPKSWDSEAGAKKEFTGKRISLDFQNADIHNILRLIGEVGGKNVVVSDAVKGKVTLRLQNVPWDQALDIVLNSKQLGKIEVGNVLRIDTTTNLIAEKRTVADEQRAEEERKLAMPLIKRVFTPKYRAAVDIANEMTKFFTKEKLGASGGGTQKDVLGKEKEGRVAVIGNDIYVETDPDSMNAIINIFTKLDQQAQQVLIESRIVEASSNFTRQLGINWGGEIGAGYSGTGPDPSSNMGASGLFGLNNAVNLISNLSYGSRIGFALLEDTFSLTAQLHAMEQAGEGRVISAPRIMASNDEKVMISQGKNIPYETAGDINTPPKLEFKKADLLLEVTPHIEQNGKIITLDLHVTKDTPDPSYATNPPIDTREAKTKLMVKNGETVVIGGIVTDSKSKRTNRVPLLHRIPLIGWMFQSYEVTDDKVELLIFLTTNIIPVVI